MTDLVPLDARVSADLVGATRANAALPGWCSAAVPLRLLAGTRGARARPPLRTGGRAQGAVAGGLSGDRRALLARDGHRRPHIRAAALFRRPGRRQPFR